jgi:hypothetical protein
MCNVNSPIRSRMIKPSRCFVGRPFLAKVRDERSKPCHVPLAAAHIHVGVPPTVSRPFSGKKKRTLQSVRSHTTPRGARNSPGRHHRRSRLPSLCFPKPNGGRRPPQLPPPLHLHPVPKNLREEGYRTAAPPLVMRTRGQTRREDKPPPAACPASLGAGRLRLILLAAFIFNALS